MKLRVAWDALLDAGGRVEGVDVAKGRAIVLTSNLGGNSWDSSVKIVDVGTTEAIVSLSRPCSSADISWVGSGGERAVCAEDSGDLKVYAVEEGPARLAEVAAFQEHDDIVSSVAATRSHDELVLSGSHDRSIKIWNIGSQRSASRDTFTGHSGGVTDVAWNSGDSQQNEFASVSLVSNKLRCSKNAYDCSVRLWDARHTQKCCACLWLGMPALALSWEPSSQPLLAVGCEDGTVTILDKRRMSGPVSAQQVHKGRVNSVKFSPPSSRWGDALSSSLLASVGDDGVLSVQRLGDDSCHNRSVLHSDYIRALAWNDASNLVTGGWDNTVRTVQLSAVSPESVQN